METNKILKGVLTFGLFTVPFICLYVANSMFFPFITGKNFAFRIIVEILFAIWLVLYLRGGISGPKKSWILFAVSVFVTVVSLATIFSEIPSRSFWSNYERMDGLVNILHLFAYFFILISTFTTERLWRWYLHTSLGVATIMSIYGVLQFAGKLVVNQGGVRVDATFGNATYMAVYMLFHIMIALYYLLQRESVVWARVAYVSLIALFSFVLYNTATRGSILGLLGGLFLTFLLSVLSTHGRSRKLVLIPLASLLLFTGGFYLARNSNLVQKSPVLSRFAGISLTDSTTQSRTIIWGMSLKGAADHPLLGWGPENFNLVFNKYFDPRLYHQETWFDRAHNIIFDWLIAAGILGLISYLSIFGALIWSLWKRSSDKVPVLQRNILVGMFVGYFFQNIFVFDNLFSYIMFFIMAAYVHFISDYEVRFNWLTELEEKWAGLWAKLSGQYGNVAVAFVPVLLVSVLYFANVKPIKANTYMLKSIYPRTISEEKLAKFKEVFDMKTFGSMEGREQLLFMLTEVRNQPNLDKNLMLKFLDYGVNEMMEQLKITGKDARHQLFMGSFMHTFGRIDDAIKYYEAALALAPNKQLIIFSLASAYRDSGRFSEALVLSKRGYELDPSFDRALVEYAASAISANDNKTASELLIGKYGTDLVADPRIIQAYVHNGQINKVVQIWENQVKDHPNDQQALFSLAASYYAARRDSEAIKQLRKIIELNPDSKVQVETYIKGIQDGTLPRG
ncbi:MAG TPA: O-antigen ligase family protein [Candidatus Paceibacterota bacterium]